MNYCGAGTEAYLFWLALDHQWRVQKQQAALIASCFESADGSYAIAGKRLNASWDNYRLMKRVNLKYDSDQAARGFHIAESKIENSKSP